MKHILISFVVDASSHDGVDTDDEEERELQRRERRGVVDVIYVFSCISNLNMLLLPVFKNYNIILN